MNGALGLMGLSNPRVGYEHSVVVDSCLFSVVTRFLEFLRHWALCAVCSVFPTFTNPKEKPKSGVGGVWNPRLELQCLISILSFRIGCWELEAFFAIYGYFAVYFLALSLYTVLEKTTDTEEYLKNSFQKCLWYKSGPTVFQLQNSILWCSVFGLFCIAIP